MNDFRVIIEQETVRYFNERQRLRQGLSQAQNQIQILEQFSGRVPASDQAPQLSAQTSEGTPPAELQAVLPALEKSVVTFEGLNASIHKKYAAIAEIQRQAQAARSMLIFCAVLAGIILIFVLLFAVHVL